MRRKAECRVGWRKRKLTEPSYNNDILRSGNGGIYHPSIRIRQLSGLKATVIEMVIQKADMN